MISPPMHLNSLLDVLPGVFFLHKVSGNLLKAGGCLTVTLKFGETFDWICFDCFSYFILMGISIPATQLTSSNLGKSSIGFVWDSNHISSWATQFCHLFITPADQIERVSISHCKVASYFFFPIVLINRGWVHHHCHRLHQH